MTLSIGKMRRRPIRRKGRSFSHVSLTRLPRGRPLRTAARRRLTRKLPRPELTARLRRNLNKVRTT